MITDCHRRQVPLDNAVVALVDALNRRFPHHTGPSDCLGRVLEELGELGAAVCAVEHEPPQRRAENPLTGLAKELLDVLRAVASIARHYDLPLDLPVPNEPAPTTPADFTTGDPLNAYERLNTLFIGAGRLAAAVHHQLGTGVKRQKYSQVNGTEWLSHAIDDFLLGLLGLADHYRIRDYLVALVEEHYRWYQEEGCVDG
jgi:NTP pyrophosphatase (non-canonical NTP hydrolase)